MGFLKMWISGFNLMIALLFVTWAKTKRYSSYKSQPKFVNLSWSFFSMVHTKQPWRFFKFRVSECFSKISNLPLHHIGKPQPQFSGKRAIVERNGVKFETQGWSWNIYGEPLTSYLSISFGVTRCTIDVSERKCFSKCCFFYTYVSF